MTYPTPDYRNADTMRFLPAATYVRPRDQFDPPLRAPEPAIGQYAVPAARRKRPSLRLALALVGVITLGFIGGFATKANAAIHRDSYFVEVVFHGTGRVVKIDGPYSTKTAADADLARESVIYGRYPLRTWFTVRETDLS